MNAKITKGVKAGRRARSFVRWGVWMCAGVLVVLFGLSGWYGTYLALFYTIDSGKPNQRVAAISCERGRLGFEYGHATSAELGLEALWVPGVRVRWDVDRIPFELSPYSPPWWAMPVYVNTSNWRATHTYLEIPLVYPTVLMVGWSLWLIRKQRKLQQRLIGCCKECGYSLAGLASDVCPECGEKYA